jgi:hypothetical protein
MRDERHVAHMEDMRRAYKILVMKSEIEGELGVVVTEGMEILKWIWKK